MSSFSNTKKFLLVMTSVISISVLVFVSVYVAQLISQPENTQDSRGEAAEEEDSADEGDGGEILFSVPISCPVSDADINGDDDVNMLDYSFFVDDYLENALNENLNERSDLNNDNDISMSDYYLFVQAYLKFKTEGPEKCEEQIDPDPSQRLGINYVYHGLSSYAQDQGKTPEDVAEEYINIQNERITDMGIHWVRSAGKADLTSFTWNDVEPTRGNFDFTLPDERVLVAQDYDISIDGTLEFHPPYEGSEGAIPGYALVDGSYFDDTMYIEYVHEVVERYDGDGTDDMPGLTKPITYWEVGNEIVLPQMFNGTAEDYAHVLEITYTEIKSNCPDCKVLIGGWISGANSEDAFQASLDYLDIVLTQGGGDYFDIFNFHSYADDCDFLLYHHTEGFQNLLTSHGLDKPFWITESNTKLYKNGEFKNTLEVQSQDIVKRIAIAYDNGVDVYFWHGLQDASDDTQVSFFDKDGNARPIYYNIQLIAYYIGNFDSVEKIDLGDDDIYFYQFDTSQGIVSILWKQGSDATMDLSSYFDTSTISSISAITEMNMETFEKEDISSDAVHLTETPIFVVP